MKPPRPAGRPKNNVYLGSFRTGEKTTLTVELTVPADLGQRVHEPGRRGGLDFPRRDLQRKPDFRPEGLGRRQPEPPERHRHRQPSPGRRPVRTRVLNAANGWACTFEYLREGYEWTVEEADVPAGYTASYRHRGQHHGDHQHPRLPARRTNRGQRGEGLGQQRPHPAPQRHRPALQKRRALRHRDPQQGKPVAVRLGRPQQGLQLERPGDQRPQGIPPRLTPSTAPTPPSPTPTAPPFPASPA